LPPEPVRVAVACFPFTAATAVHFDGDVREIVTLTLTRFELDVPGTRVRNATESPAPAVAEPAAGVEDFDTWTVSASAKCLLECRFDGVFEEVDVVEAALELVLDLPPPPHAASASDARAARSTARGRARCPRLGRMRRSA
jgi:hypothetical protein